MKDLNQQRRKESNMTTIDIPGYSSATLTTLGFTPNITARALNYTKVYTISKRIFIGILHENGDYELTKVGGITRPLDLKIYSKAWDIFYHEIIKSKEVYKPAPEKPENNLISNPNQLPTNGVFIDLTQEHPENDPTLNQTCPSCNTKSNYNIDSITQSPDGHKVFHLKCNNCHSDWTYIE